MVIEWLKSTSERYRCCCWNRIIDRRVEKDDLDENKKILNNTVEKMKDPMNLEMVNLRNVDRKKVKEEI